MGSVRRRGDHVRLTLTAADAAIVISLTSQVLELLGDVDAPPAGEESLQDLLEGSQQAVPAPQDPALLRLLPDGYREDDAASAEFRRLTEADLRATKRTSLSRIVGDLHSPEAAQRGGGVRLDLDDEAAEIWLTALNDVRLTFGTRIEVREDMDDERMSLAVDSMRYAEIATYDWFSWLQDAILRALTDE
jgi:hypothetical protein